MRRPNRDGCTVFSRHMESVVGFGRIGNQAGISRQSGIAMSDAHDGIGIAL